MEVILNIPNNKIPRIIAAFKGLYPIPNDEAGEPLFNDNAWGKESIRRFIIRSVARYETKIAKELAVVAQEDDLVS